MRFSIIFVVILLEIWPTQVRSIFHIEYTTNKYQRKPNYGPNLKTFLFECKTDPEAHHEQGMKPPIICILLDDVSKLQEIYTTRNFFMVQDAALPPDQQIEFLDVLEKSLSSLPRHLFLAVSDEAPLDYPDFLRSEQEKMPNYASFITDEDRVFAFTRITNLSVFRRCSDWYTLAFRAYMEKLRTWTDVHWQKFSEYRICGFFFTVKLKEQTEGNCGTVNDSPQLAIKTEITIAQLLTKMIDPCLIRTLTNSSKGGNRLSDKAANFHCKTYCRFLSVLPLVLKKGPVATQCRDLTLGECVGNECVCFQESRDSFQWFASDPKSPAELRHVKMAECNNRLVTMATDRGIARFPGHEQMTPRLPTMGVSVSGLWGWALYPRYVPKVKAKRMSTQERWAASRKANAEDNPESWEKRSVQWDPKVEDIPEIDAGFPEMNL